MGSRWLLLIPIPSYLGLIWLFMQLLNLVEMTNVLMSKIYAFVIHFTLMSLLCCLDLYNLARLTSITTRIKGEDIRAKHKGGSTRCKKIKNLEESISSSKASTSKYEVIKSFNVLWWHKLLAKLLWSQGIFSLFPLASFYVKKGEKYDIVLAYLLYVCVKYWTSYDV